MIGLVEMRLEIVARRNVARIVARGEQHPVEPAQPLGCEVACDIIALEERHRRHRGVGVRPVARADRHLVALAGQMEGGVAAERTAAADYEYLHAIAPLGVTGRVSSQSTISVRRVKRHAPSSRRQRS